jgi:hypothetical protein
MGSPFPIEIQERIYLGLPVRDRVRFRSAMPKDARIRYKCPAEERRLGLFVRFIKKRKIAALSENMLAFMETIERDDPTLDEIAEFFPDAVEKHRSSRPVLTMTLVDLIRDGTVSEEDVLARLSEDLARRLNGDDWALRMMLYDCKPEMYDIIIIHPDIRRFVDRAHFMFAVIAHTNEALIMHLKHRGNHMGINVQAHMRSLATDIVSRTSSISISDPHFMLIALKHVAFTVEELERLWDKCFENMNLVAVEAIDNILGAM